MSSVIDWFTGLNFAFECVTLLVVSPLFFFLVGLVIFSQEPPGPSFWGTEKPSFWRVFAGTAGIGFISSLILFAIFHVTYLINWALVLIGFQENWGVAFVIGLLSVLIGVYYWFEGRHIK